MTIAMGLAPNYPLALAAGMGLNAAVAFQLVAGLKLPWQAAMGVVFLEGIILTALVLTGFREAIMDAIPLSLKRAIGVGIGLFILFIGLVSAGIVKPGPPGVPVTLGELTAPPVAVALFGLFLTLWLQARRVSGGAPRRHPRHAPRSPSPSTPGPVGARSPFPARRSCPPRWSPCPISRPSARASISPSSRASGWSSRVVSVFSLMLSDFFDTMGTVIGIGGEAGWLTADGKLPRLNRVLLVDSLAAAAGGAAGASSATTYIESAAGVSAGARTGLASVVTGACFLVALFLTPAGGHRAGPGHRARADRRRLPDDGVAREIPFGDLEEGFPALLTMTVMPFTYSITNGIGAGFLAYCFIKLVRGKGRQVHLMMYLASAAFVVYFALPLLQRLLLLR